MSTESLQDFEKMEAKVATETEKVVAITDNVNIAPLSKLGSGPPATPSTTDTEEEGQLGQGQGCGDEVVESDKRQVPLEVIASGRDEDEVDRRMNDLGDYDPLKLKGWTTEPCNHTLLSSAVDKRVSELREQDLAAIERRVSELREVGVAAVDKTVNELREEGVAAVDKTVNELRDQGVAAMDRRVNELRGQDSEEPKRIADLINRTMESEVWHSAIMERTLNDLDDYDSSSEPNQWNADLNHTIESVAEVWHEAMDRTFNDLDDRETKQYRWKAVPCNQKVTFADHARDEDVDKRGKDLGARDSLETKQYRRTVEPCNHKLLSAAHACHICVPIPDEAAALLEDSIGLTRTDARKAGFTFLRYLRDNRHTNRVKGLLKYVTGSEVIKKRSKRAIDGIVHQPEALTKEGQLKLALRNVSRQKGVWGAFEEEEVVLEHFKHLNMSLAALDKATVRKLLREDGYQGIKSLTIFFAMEKQKRWDVRWDLRAEIMRSFELLIIKDASGTFNVLVSSDLPVDLANSIKQEYIENMTGEKRIKRYATLLLAIFTCGRHLEVDHLQRIDTEFIYILLQISEGITEGYSAELRDIAAEMILAYNLHFSVREFYSNKVVAALAVFKDADYLKQKMFTFLMNKGPRAKVICAAHAVVKLALELVSCQNIREFFLDSDLNIIVTGVIPHICELEAGNEKRTLALKLLLVILRRLEFNHNGIRKITKMLNAIYIEPANEESRRDKKIAKKIAKEVEESKRQTTTFLSTISIY